MRQPRARRSAFTLVEVTLALGVAAFSLVAIFGLLPVGINTNATALEQSAAGSILSAVVADLRSTPATVPKGQAATTQQFLIAIPASPVTASAVASVLYVTNDGKSTATLAPDSHFVLSVAFVPNGSATRAPTFAVLKLSWPAAAGPNRGTGSVEQFVVLDRN